jgi:hypothetical protein
MKSRKARTDLSTATGVVLKTLESGEPFTLNKLSNETALNFRTVRKVLGILEKYQTVLLQKRIDITNLDNLTIIQMKERSGMLSLPEKVRHLIIKASYYPTVSREEEILTYMLAHNATGMNSGIRIDKDQTLTKLIKAGHIEEKKGKFYLTEMGIVVAGGAITLYPELKGSR